MCDLSLLVLEDIGFKYQPYVCNGCHDFSMVVLLKLEDFVILKVKSIDYR